MIASNRNHLNGVTIVTNQPIRPQAAHRNTDSEKTGVIKPVADKRKPVELVPFLALVVLAAGVYATAWLATTSPAIRVLVGSVAFAVLLLAASNGIKIRNRP